MVEGRRTDKEVHQVYRTNTYTGLLTNKKGC